MSLGTGSIFLTDIAILTVSALALSLVFARLRLPVVSGEIIAGVVVGPYVLNLVSDPVVINEVSQIGVVLLLFILGLELDPREIRSIILRIGGLTAIEVGISATVIFVGSIFLTHNIISSVIISISLSFTSTAIVGRILLDHFQQQEMAKKGELQAVPDYRKILISLLVVEDVIAIIFLILIPEISGAPPAFLPILEVSLGGVALLLASYFFGRYIAPRVINYFAHFELESGDIPFLFSLALGIIFGALANYLGYSPAIGSFMIGLALRGKYSKFVSQRIRPIRDLFLILFFVSMGTLIDPFASAAFPVILIGLVVLAILSKLAGGFVAGSVLPSGIPASSLAMWLLPRGEFSLIIAQTALASQAISLSAFSTIGICVMITALLGPIYLASRDKSASKSEFPLRPKVDE